jgi:hypothetical protein
MDSGSETIEMHNLKPEDNGLPDVFAQGCSRNREGLSTNDSACVSVSQHSGSEDLELEFMAHTMAHSYVPLKKTGATIIKSGTTFLRRNGKQDWIRCMLWICRNDQSKIDCLGHN